MKNEASSIKKLTVQALSVIQMPNSFPKSNDYACVPSRHDSEFVVGNQTHFDNKENVEDQLEFSFTCIDLKETLIFADEIFYDGKIRPSFATLEKSIVLTTTYDNNTLPLQPSLKKLFAVEKPNKFSSHSEGISEGSFNEASPNITMVGMDASANKCKKRKPLTFSKTRRFQENIKLQTNSDAQDTFIFWNPSEPVSIDFQDAKEKKVSPNRGKGRKSKTTLSPHEKVYVMNKKRTENSKQKSFLPYRQNLIGFFTNKNRFSKDINSF
ncbi:hypothetical protein Fmac_005595 [Flemingia macrophylla]|uniref:Uncharacterized protein n=1 Tax=Flemingia macrophylla TaxID=520843 RepID=A0ABD1N866_9FABA